MEGLTGTVKGSNHEAATGRQLDYDWSDSREISSKIISAKSALAERRQTAHQPGDRLIGTIVEPARRSPTTRKRALADMMACSWLAIGKDSPRSPVLSCVFTHTHGCRTGCQYGLATCKMRRAPQEATSRGENTTSMSRALGTLEPYFFPPPTSTLRVLTCADEAGSCKASHAIFFFSASFAPPFVEEGVSLVLASALEPAPSIRDGRVLILSQGVVLPRPTLHRRSAHKVADAS